MTLKNVEGDLEISARHLPPPPLSPNLSLSLSLPHIHAYIYTIHTNIQLVCLPNFQFTRHQCLLFKSTKFSPLSLSSSFLSRLISPAVSSLLFRRMTKSVKSNSKRVSIDSSELQESERDSSNDIGKGKRLWNKVKYQLVEYHSLPAYLKDNEFILAHYRSEWPIKHIFMSIFSIHNETLNVWTHLIGFFLFLTLTIYTAMEVPKVVDINTLQHLHDVLRKADMHKLREDLLTCLPSFPAFPDLHKFRDALKNSSPLTDLLISISNWHIIELVSNCLPESFSHINHTDVCVLHNVKDDMVSMIAPTTTRQITRWPFYSFMGGAMFCLLASSVCHLFSCHSKRLAYVMLRIDYAGIAALISTSFYPIVYYSFMCYPFFCMLYMGFITILGIATVLVSLFPVFDRPEYRTVRAALFFGMGFSGVAPVLHKLILFSHRPEALHTTGYEILMGVFYGIGVLVYAMRIPERWMPGKFDIAGHSHQLFHVLVVAGAYTHYCAGLVYLKWRDMEGC